MRPNTYHIRIRGEKGEDAKLHNFADCPPVKPSTYMKKKNLERYVQMTSDFELQWLDDWSIFFTHLHAVYIKKEVAQLRPGSKM